MPSLTKTILAIAAFSPLALAAPSSTTLTKRADYHPTTDANQADYCGEAVDRYSTNDNSPLASDCQQIARDHPGPGYWLITSAETAAVGKDGFVRLA